MTVPMAELPTRPNHDVEVVVVYAKADFLQIGIDNDYQDVRSWAMCVVDFNFTPAQMKPSEVSR